MSLVEPRLRARFAPFVAFVSFCSRVVRTGEEEPRDAVNQLDLMEVEHQPQRHVQQFHITQQLGLVDRQDGLDGLEFNQETTLDQQIEPQRLLEHVVLVVDDDLLLLESGDASELEFTQEAPFVDALQQSRPHDPVHFDGGANDLTG
jgi:hypothetical protein